MANQLQEAILGAVDTIVAERVSSLQLDKTVTAIVVSCSNSLTNEYKVEYNGGIISAYAEDGKTYRPNSKVYVLIPSNDLGSRKIILGVANQSGDDDNITYISSLINNYSTIGKNVITVKDSNLRGFGVNSYLKKDSLVLYKHGDEKSLLSIDEDEFANNLREATALMVEGSFFTRLPKTHAIDVKGTYTLDITLAFKDKNETEINIYEDGLPTDLVINNMGTTGTVADYLRKIWEDTTKTLSDKRKYTQYTIQALQEYLATHPKELETKIQAIQNFIKDIDPLTKPSSSNETSENYKTLEPIIKEEQQHLEEIIAGPDNKNTTPLLKYFTYSLSSTKMLGNPYAFSKYIEQYNIFPIDAANFDHVERVEFSCQGFVEEDDLNKADLYGDDIFCRELELYCMRPLSSTDGEYTLRLAMPQGSTLKTDQSTEVINIVASMLKQDLDITNQTMFYWFSYDNRITPSSEGYSKYGGYKWKLLSGGVEGQQQFKGSDNRAFENKYKCVAAYKEDITLVYEFTIYNQSVARTIEVTSSLGQHFSFDLGSPVFKCLVNGKESNFDEGITTNHHPDSYYYFIWSKTEDDLGTVVFDKTLDQLNEEWTEQFNNGEGTLSLDNMLMLELQMDQLKGIDFEPGKNELIYPMYNVESFAEFTCSVYLKDTQDGEFYPIGSASINVVNEDTATPTDYYIKIDNGNQVFQYDEKGLSPELDRFDNPNEIKKLSATFYDKNNQKVNPNLYDLKWRIPLTNTLINRSKSIPLVEDPSTGLLNLVPTDEYDLQIKENYDYSAINNQIEAVITFEGRVYTQATNFLFTKIGENGTNGTDIVCRITPNENIVGSGNNSWLKDYRLAIESYITDTPDKKRVWYWNTDNPTGISTNPFTIQVFKRNERLSEDKFTTSWSLAGGGGNPNIDNNISKYLTVSTTPFLTWNETDAQKRLYRNQILRAKAVVKPGEDDVSVTENYYAFYPIPVIKWNNTKTYEIKIRKTGTLESILYNADGREPIYDDNRGIELVLERNSTKRYIEWFAEGGFPQDKNNSATNKNYEDNPQNAAFSLKLPKEDGETDFVSTIGKDFDSFVEESSSYRIYIQPNNAYNGEYSNNLVHAKIYKNSGDKTPEVEIWIPIHMSLNTYGLASLNQWDGNHVEINEDENYIMAPQIGAGIKDKDNNFTGLVMGSVKNYNNDTEKVGLHGYSNGRQSIFMDAYTGNTILGLPTDSRGENNSTDKDGNPIEGQIQLIPNGDSQIGGWHIGQNDLFNIPAINEAKNSSQDRDKYYTDMSQYSGYEVLQINKDKLGVYKSWSNSSLSGDKGEGLDSKFKIAIPHDLGGILLNANPGRISIKTKPFTIEENPNIYFNPLALQEYKDQNIPSNRILKDSYLMPGDSYELELNPNSDSVFTLYQHTKYYTKRGTVELEKKKDNEPIRIARVGIDNQGRFYTNALKDNATALSLGNITAFQENTLFKGVKFEIGATANDTTPLLKFFTEFQDSTNAYRNTTLYISGTDQTDEYTRSISIHGKTLSFYAGSNSLPVNGSRRQTYHKLVIDKNEIQLGHFADNNKNYLKLSTEADKATELKLNTKLDINTNTKSTTLITGLLTIDTATFNTNINTNNYSATFTGNEIHTVTGDIELKAHNSNKLSLKTTDVKLENTSDRFLQLGSGNVNGSTDEGSWLKTDGGLGIKSYLNSHFRVSNGSLLITAQSDNNTLELGGSSGNNTGINGARLFLGKANNGNGSGRFILSSAQGGIYSDPGISGGKVRIWPKLEVEQVAIGTSTFNSALNVEGDIIVSKDINLSKLKTCANSGVSHFVGEWINGHDSLIHNLESWKTSHDTWAGQQADKLTKLKDTYDTHKHNFSVTTAVQAYNIEVQKANGTINMPHYSGNTIRLYNGDQDVSLPSYTRAEIDIKNGARIPITVPSKNITVSGTSTGPV